MMRLILISVFCVSCTTTATKLTGTESKPEAQTTIEQKEEPAKVSHPANVNPTSSTIKRTRKEAIKKIQEDCGEQYEIVNERPDEEGPSAAVGVSTTVTKDKRKRRSSVYVEYRCKG